MKRYILIFLPLTFLLVSMVSCNLDFYPSDELNAEILLSDEGGAKYVTDGCYALLKDEVEYIGYASGNTYVRHYFQMTEFQSDNICLSGRTEDVLYQATCYKMTDNLKNTGTLWWLAYKVIYSANSVIEALEDGASVSSDQLKGECYFLRAMCHFHLVTLYAKPYSFGRENPGVILRTSTNTSTTTRASVGVVYDQIVSDLTKAAQLMTTSSARENAGYASHDAALGLLSRVYLYMGENGKVIDTVNEMLGGADPSSKLEPNFAGYFANALNSRETLFAVAHTALETKGQSSLGSMYLNDGMGWGEIYSSDPLNNLYERYPGDIRYQYVVPQYAASGADVVTFPVETEADDFRSNEIRVVTLDGVTGKYTFTDEGTRYYVEPETVNGEYTEYSVTYKGVKCPARLTKQMANRNTFYSYYVSKFSYQDNDPMLSSPVMLRWGEVILNRAEAYAKTAGKEAEALADVNILRTRAGLTGNALFSTSNMHGYASVLDVVLDERRLELAFEGHRAFDLYRNKLNMDRRYAGVQPWEIVDYNDNKIQYPIPFDEHSVSGIAQNPGY